MIDKLNIFSSNKPLQQFFSYALIGLLTNALGYVIYLILTYLWGSPKIAMTALYFFGATISFLANRRFTFLHDGSIGITGARYLMVHIACYLLNLVLLIVFVDWFDFPHQIIQAIAIIVVAIFSFTLLRIFVFALN